jgi:hypothetical protein
MRRLFLAVFVSMTLTLTIAAGACSGTTSTTTATKPGGGALVNSDSVVTVKIQALGKQSTGYGWKLDVLIQNTQDVDALVNPVKADVGKVITVVTDQDMSSFKANDVATARIKYAGDVNTPGGISLNIYNVVLQ